MFNFLLPYAFSFKNFAKLGLVLLLVLGSIYGYVYVRGLYETAIKNAQELGRQEIIRNQEMLKSDILKEQEEINRVAKEELKTVIIEQNKEIKDLERKLQIEHDLDRLLQAKPGLILNIVQKGTNEKLQDLEEITQWED